jgi:hypothetical protein
MVSTMSTVVTRPWCALVDRFGGRQPRRVESNVTSVAAISLSIVLGSRWRAHLLQGIGDVQRRRRR